MMKEIIKLKFNVKEHSYKYVHNRTCKHILALHSSELHNKIKNKQQEKKNKRDDINFHDILCGMPLNINI